MKNLIKKMYGIDFKAMIKIAPLVYKLKTERGNFILKYIDNPDVDNIYARLSMLRLESFSVPIKNVYGHYITLHENRYFEIDDFYEDEPVVAKDIRVRFYLRALANLHNQSFFSLRVRKGFFEESIEFIENLINQASSDLENNIRFIERLDYKSPSQWLFLLNNQLFYQALYDAKRHLDSFKDKTKEKTMLRVSLNYLNFDYSHIIVKSNKIISTHKMIIGPPIYDLKHLFDKSFHGSIDISSFFEEYLKKFHLYEYEKEWLMALMLIPIIDFRGQDEVEKIVNITNSVHHLKNAREIGRILADTDKKNKDTEVDD